MNIAIIYKHNQCENLDDMVLYANPYMVVTPRGYTKHYYNGSQRIAARIGGYWHDESVFVSSPALTNAAESLWAATLYKEELREQETPFNEVYVSPSGVFLPVPQYGPVVANLSGMHADDLLSPVFSGHNSERTSDDTVGIYFYHSDHLGSANWITNSQGEAVQYLHYMPFGELWENQQASAYNERFKFTGKERDAETGYDYFVARYYSPMIGHWLSPDPLANKYPNISPYAYCSWNPLKYIDPNGMYIEVSQNGDGTYSVISGEVNDDKNIYIVTDGERTGEVLGEMFSQYSFFDTEGNVVHSNIDPADMSGDNFLADIQANPPSLLDYISPAEKEDNKSGRNFGHYDFKSNGKSKSELQNMSQKERDAYYYRGMPINIGGKTTYGTARDVGNYAAGYFAARKGLGILSTLLGFDAYQSWTSGRFEKEPPVSRIPQIRGYYHGFIDNFTR